MTNIFISVNEGKNCVVLTDSVVLLVVILLFIELVFSFFFFVPPDSNLGGHIKRLKILVFVLNRRKL